jgi:hypothetical protein
MFYFLSGDDLKRAREWDLFVRFCEAGQLGVDPAEIDMLDPPWPNLKAELFGSEKGTDAFFGQKCVCPLFRRQAAQPRTVH